MRESMRVYLLIISFALLLQPAFAIVPTMDIYQQSQDITAIADYAQNIGAYVEKLSVLATQAEQIRQLHGLEQVSAAGNALCELCTPVDQKKLTTYINQVNSDLCSQFSFAMQNITGISKSFNSLREIITQVYKNPKSSGLALQQAAVETQMASQNTLTQIQLLRAQQAQKQLAEQKLEQQNTTAVYQGFKNAGL